jgi:hypothetical protein
MNNSELREAIFQQKANPVGKRVAWSPDQMGELREMVFSAPEKTLRAALPQRKSFSPRPDTARAKLVDAGVLDAAGSTSTASRFIFKISDESVDRARDVISLSGWNLEAFARNPVILPCHDSSALPVARSSLPAHHGAALVAIADFSGAESVSASVEVRDAVRAGLIKGASVGFRPIKFRLSTSPDRPMGIDYLQNELLEWSICSIPANANCIMLGVASGKAFKSAPNAISSTKFPAGTCGREWHAKCGLLNPGDCEIHHSTQTQSRADRIKEVARLTGGR